MEETVLEKVCTKCGVSKPLGEFYVQKAGLYGVRGNCKECDRQYREINKERIKERKKQYNEKNKEKINERSRQFYQDNKEYCLEQNKQYRQKNKEKCNERSKKYHRDNREQIIEQKKQYYQNNKESCNERSRQDYQNNKERYAEYGKQYYQNNKEQISERNKQYRESHKEEMNEYNRQYYQDNKEKLNKQNVEYTRKRLSGDPTFRFIMRIRNLVYCAFRNQGFSKTSRTAQILGCTFKEFYDYIDSQLVEGMTWENQGEAWHLDHIVPLATAQTEEEILKLNHYTNFQPLWAEDNLAKSDRLDWQKDPAKYIPKKKPEDSNVGSTPAN